VKGMRAAGHMGAETVTQRNLTVVRVDADKNILVVKGSVPGGSGGYVVIRKGGGRWGGRRRPRRPRPRAPRARGSRRAAGATPPPTAGARPRASKSRDVREW